MHLFNKLLNQTTLGVFYILIVVFPIFFIPSTRDFLIYSKLYLIIVVASIFLVLSFIRFVLTRKIYWTQNPATQSVVLIILSFILSIVLISPNKLQAIFNPQFGLLSIVFLIVLYYGFAAFFSKVKTLPVILLSISTGLTSLFTLVVMIDPFRGVDLPNTWNFLSNKVFNPVGTSYHFIAFLMSVLLMIGAYVYRSFKSRHANKQQYKLIVISLGIISAFILISATFHGFLVYQQLSSEGAQLSLTPLNLSWFATVEILKNPLTALFGVGVDNFSSIFTQVRTIEYNEGPLWEINSFATSGSAFTHIITELGVLGATAFGILILGFIKKIKFVRLESAVFFFASITVLALLPPSLVSFFMFFVSLAILTSDLERNKSFDSYSIDLGSLMPIYISTVIITIVFYGGVGYYVFNNASSEFYFKKSLDAINDNNLNDLYNNQLQAIQLAGFNEEFRRQFANTNILIANNIAAKGEENLTEEDKQLIGQAIQAAISEGKTAVSLNPSKVSNWQVLAGIYRQIINVVEDAPVWTVSAYQQAIVLDPRNPILRLDLGGVYYLFENYDEAQKMFEQAVSLKRDWANARYNLGWAFYQKGMFAQAVEQMQLVVPLIDPVKQAEDYTAAQKVLDDFKKKYEEELAKNTDAAEEVTTPQVRPTQPPRQLNLPAEPEAQLEERINLPEENSPSETTVTEESGNP